MENQPNSESEIYDRRLLAANRAATAATTLLALATLAGCVAAFRAGFQSFQDPGIPAVLLGLSFSCFAALCGTLLFAAVTMEKEDHVYRLGKRPAADTAAEDRPQPLIRTFKSGTIHLLEDPESGEEYLAYKTGYWAYYRFWSMWTMQRVEHEDIGVCLSVSFAMPVDRDKEAVNRRLAETFHSAQAHAASAGLRNQAAAGTEKEAALAR